MQLRALGLTWQVSDTVTDTVWMLVLVTVTTDRCPPPPPLISTDGVTAASAGDSSELASSEAIAREDFIADSCALVYRIGLPVGQ